MQQPNRIVGAGLSGLLAAYAFPGIPIAEAAPAPRQAHAAVLRFRSDVVARLTGIPFRQVTVRKGLWYRGAFVQPNIALANAYSMKTLSGLYPDRSIWDLAPAARFIAPGDFYDRLIAHAAGRIQWGSQDDFKDGPLISTAPMPALLKVGLIEAAPPLRRAAIAVERFRVPDCDVFETVYFPDPKLAIYRASITGNLLTVERVAGVVTSLDNDAIRLAFGIDPAACEKIDEARQEYGKIVPLEPRERKRILFELTHWHNIYSLGRFATWRNVLLDDVVSDIDVIKLLLNSASDYDVARARAGAK